MYRGFRWAVFAAFVLVAVAVGFTSYNAGVSHGLAVSAAATAVQQQPGSAAAPPPPALYAPYGPYYGWYGPGYRPWGFGFFGPVLFLLFWFFIFRLIFWGGFHRRRWYYGGGRYDAPPAFEEWHRRAHDRMSGQPTPTQTI
jgi:hypothetical protein